VNVDLDLVTVVLEAAKHGQGVADVYIVRREPHADFGLTLAGLTSVVAVIVQPKHTSHHAC